MLRGQASLWSLFLCACGGIAAPGSSVGADGGPTSNLCQAPPPQHRPEAPTCSLHESDGGACTVDTDCSGAPRGTPQFCYQGRCGHDQCARDSDCQSGYVCSCGGEPGGLVSGVFGNRCVPADCHVDSDCGQCGWCAPSADFTCGPTYGAASYHCQRPGTSCTSNADCGGDGGFDTPFCAFDPMTNAWACKTGYCAG